MKNKEWYDLVQPKKLDKDYNFKLLKEYAPVLRGLENIFNHGLAAFTVGEEEIIKTKDLFGVLGQENSLPEHYHNEDIPQINNGGSIKCVIDDSNINESQSNYTLVTLRNTYSELFKFPDDSEIEGEGALAICYSLFRAGWVPFKKVFRGKNRMFVKQVKLDLVDTSDIFVEVQVMCKNKCKVAFIPTDDQGRSDINAIEEIISGKKVEE